MRLKSRPLLLFILGEQRRIEKPGRGLGWYCENCKDKGLALRPSRSRCFAGEKRADRASENTIDPRPGNRIQVL